VKTTDKQIAANRKNAAKSTGPTTESGKAIAARNSLKHGLLAKEIVISAGEGLENQEQFDTLLNDLHNQFSPQGTLEEMLVEKIAVAYWRLRRAHRFEVGIIRNKLDNLTDIYYKETNSYYNKPIHKTDQQIESDIQKARDNISQWQGDKDHFTKLWQSGKDPKDIYNDNYQANWDWFRDEAEEEGVESFSNSPVSIREALRKARWSNDKIWQLHLKVCDDAIADQQQIIRNLNSKKENNKLTLQVRRKLNSIPEGQELNRLLKYEGSIERQFYKAIDQLERLQRLRKGDAVPPPVSIDLNVNQQQDG
jgi:hypothetical protein